MSDTDEITRLRADNERLRAALRDARECIEAWAGYASEYFQEKHALASDLARIDAAQPALSSWRPIDQPPIHPMRVLLFSPDQYDANWNGADYGIRVAYFANGHWRDQGTNHDACEFDTPTHWMPLPPAPGKEEA